MRGERRHVIGRLPVEQQPPASKASSSQHHGERLPKLLDGVHDEGGAHPVSKALKVSKVVGGHNDLSDSGAHRTEHLFLTDGQLATRGRPT